MTPNSGSREVMPSSTRGVEPHRCRACSGRRDASRARFSAPGSGSPLAKFSRPLISPTSSAAVVIARATETPKVIRSFCSGTADVGIAEDRHAGVADDADRLDGLGDQQRREEVGHVGAEAGFVAGVGQLGREAQPERRTAARASATRRTLVRDDEVFDVAWSDRRSKSSRRRQRRARPRSVMVRR